MAKLKNTTMKKTAMQEWLEWIKAYEYELPLELQIKAKELLVLEKQQIIDAYHINPLESKWKNIGEKYYNSLNKQD